MLGNDANLKQINALKKKLNWGEFPPFYHMVTNSLAEIENANIHGFDNALKYITDRRNWNLNLLQGERLSDGQIVCESKPRLALYHLHTKQGYEARCFPLANDNEIDQYVKDHPLMEFRVWDPSLMCSIVKIAHFAEFTALAFTKGDDADRALVQYAYKLTEDILNTLESNTNIVKVEGESVRSIILKCGKHAQKLVQSQGAGELKVNPLSQSDS